MDHVTVYRGVQTFPPEGVDAARASRHSVGDRWFVDETYNQVAGCWAYLYRAVDQQRQVINVLSSERRNARAAPALFTRVVSVGPVPVEVTTDRGPVYSRVLDELVPAARHVLEQYATNVVAADHGRLKARPRPCAGSRDCGLLGSSRQVTRSRRTCAADTTTSSLTNRRPSLASAPPSTNSTSASERGSAGLTHVKIIPGLINATAVRMLWGTGMVSGSPK